MSRDINVRSVDTLSAANYFANGALLIDEFDPVILDDVRRECILWNRIDKRLAPGETTNGFDQTGIATGRAAPRRNLGFSATGPTRQARVPKTVKAIVADTTFGLFDRSVYQQQGRRFGNLEAKDVQDLMTACIRKWAVLSYLGDAASSDDEFDGLRTLIGAGTTVDDGASIIGAINTALISMMNDTDVAFRPTAIYTNARVIYLINLELMKIGDRLLYAPIKVGESVFDTAQLATPVGFMPLIADPWNTAVAGTPVVYPTYIMDETKLSWQYVEVLGAPGADPRTFEIALTNTIDLQYKCVMFGALEMLGTARGHFLRLNIEDRTTPVPPTGS